MEASGIWFSCHPGIIRHLGLSVYTCELGEWTPEYPSNPDIQIQLCMSTPHTAMSEVVIKKLLPTPGVNLFLCMVDQDVRGLARGRTETSVCSRIRPLPAQGSEWGGNVCPLKAQQQPQAVKAKSSG